MELSGTRLAALVGKRRQNIYILATKGKLVKDKNGKYESTHPVNANYLRVHGIHPETLESLELLGTQVDRLTENPTKETPTPARGRRGNRKKTPKKKNTRPESDSGRTRASLAEAEEDSGGLREYADRNDIDDIAEINDIDTITGEDFEQITGLPEKLLNLTLKEAVLKYGSMHNLKMQADMLKILTSARDTDVRTEERRRNLIPREFVENRIKAHLELERNQLFDYPDAQIDLIISEVLADSEEARRKIPETMRRDFAKIFKETRKAIAKQFNDLREKYTDEPQTEQA